MYNDAVMTLRTALSLLLASLVLPAVGCGGAGPYGYAREYVPTGDEEPYLEHQAQAEYGDVRRDPASFRSAKLGWFGVVTSIEDAGHGRTAVHMTFRTHQHRHLCADERSSSCRVTVSERPGGPFTAILTLKPDDRRGEDRLWTGSLVKIYGSPTGDFDSQGGPVLEARWYRHWPHGKYVTTGASVTMRR